MYLLILYDQAICCERAVDLHSIMYLLILQPEEDDIVTATLFTFHNVSINSDVKLFPQGYSAHLHSIMYLLIRGKRRRKNSSKSIYIP